MRTLRFPRTAAPAPGQVRTVESGGRRIGLVWVDGELHGLADACPHRGAPLCSAGMLVHRVESDGERVVRCEPADRLRCPWHKWDFDIASGRCAVIDESFCRSEPAAALRGFGVGFFPSAMRRSFSSLKPLIGK